MTIYAGDAYADVLLVTERKWLRNRRGLLCSALPDEAESRKKHGEEPDHVMPNARKSTREDQTISSF